MRITPVAVLTCWAMTVVPMSAGANTLEGNSSLNPVFSDTTPVKAQHPVSFLDAWQAVLSQNDGLAAERANIERSENMQDAAKDLYLPSISATAKYTRLDKPVEIKPLILLTACRLALLCPPYLLLTSYLPPS